MRVFIGGSPGISVLPTLAVERIDDAISEDAEFLVGDAPGVDALVQKYLHERGVLSVRVFHSTPQRRFNLGHWPEQLVDSGLKSTSSAMHGAKDREMASHCDQALMVWDTKSVGTITNVLDVAGVDDGRKLDPLDAVDSSGRHNLLDLKSDPRPGSLA